jgi:LysM repeat protein
VGISCSAAVASPSVGSGVSDAITFNAAGNLAAGTYPATITATGGGHTHTTQILIDCVPATSAPEFIPAPGTYLDEQTVTLRDATRGAILYYTTDGSVPTASSAAYTGPITVKSTATLRAIAIAPKYSLSGVATGSYTISPVPATPVFSVASGTYISAQTVAISDATDGVKIYYTLNGSNPTAKSTLYTGPVLVKNSGTLQAIAVAPGGTPSKVALARYVLVAATPQISPPGGRYPGLVTVTMSSASPNATIFYTTNGSMPTVESARYTGPIVVHSSEKVTAMAAETGFTPSQIVEAQYVMGPIAGPPGSPVNPVSASVR